MRHSLPILLAIGWWLSFPAGAFCQVDANPTSQAIQPSKPRKPTGAGLLAQAARQLEREPGIEMRLRQRISVFGRQLIGSGAYLQSRQGAARVKSRLELKLQVGGRVSSIQQICDGRRLWIRHDLPDGTRLVRIDLRRVRDALTAESDQQTPNSPNHGPNNASNGPPIGAVASSTQYWLTGGGIAGLLAGIRENFEFSDVEPSEYQGKPTWVLRGEWKPHRLKMLAGLSQEEKQQPQETTPSQLPAHLPDQVVVTLAKRGEFRLFPMRIEYLRRTTDGAGQGRGGSPPYSTIEFYHLRRLNWVDDRRFDYFPGDQRVEDGTENYLAKLRRSEGRRKKKTEKTAKAAQVKLKR